MRVCVRLDDDATRSATSGLTRCRFALHIFIRVSTYAAAVVIGEGTGKPGVGGVYNLMRPGALARTTPTANPLIPLTFSPQAHRMHMGWAGPVDSTG